MDSPVKGAMEVPPQQCLSGCRALPVAQVGRVGETIHAWLASSVWCSLEGLVDAREVCLVLSIPNGFAVCTMCPFRVLFVRSEWTAGRHAPRAARRAGPTGLQTGLCTLNCITTDV